MRLRMMMIGLLSMLASWAAGAEDASMQKAVTESLGTTVLPAGRTGHEQVQAFLRRRIPKLVVPPDATAWDRAAAELRQKILSEVILRGVPKDIVDARPRVEWGATIKTGNGYVIRKLAYEGYPGLWIPALLYEPEVLKGKVAASLNLKGHEPLGKAVPYEQARCINLAKRGILALSPDWIGYGQLRGESTSAFDAHDNQTYLDLCGRSGVAVFYLCAKRGLDVLLDHPNADPDRVIVTGLSGGGWRTIFLSALDTRVKLAVPAAGYVNFSARVDFLEDTGDKEQNPTDLGLYADYSHLTALMAPRPTLLIYNAKDFFNPTRTRPGLYEPVLPFYKLYGREKDFAFHVNQDPGDHNYGVDNRQAFYRFLNDHFPPAGKRIDAEIDSDKEMLGEDALRVDLPKDNPVGGGTWAVLAAKVIDGLPRTQLPPADAAARDRWNADLRRRLEQVIRYKPLTAVADKSSPLAFNQPPLAARAVLYRVGEEWTLPTVEISPGKPKGTALLVSDGGKAQSAPLAAKLLASGRRVVAADILFTGEMTTRANPWQYTQMVEAMGERPLGLKMAQILAVRDALARQYADSPITIVGNGPESAVAALLAAALAGKGDRVLTLGLPKSLKELITSGGFYDRSPSLFCFGLLELADIEHFVALAGAGNVTRCKSIDDVAAAAP